MVDGILFQPSVMSSVEISRHRGDLPIVILGEGAAPLPVDRVMIDNVAAAREATEHVIALGRRRIGFAGHERDGLSATSTQRIMGYQQALEEHGIRPDPALLFPSTEISPTGAVTGIGAALDAGARVDGLVCRDDLAAIGALRALGERGLKVPEDVAVTGWDNIELSRVTFPDITTVAPNLTLLAQRAVHMLGERIGGYTGPGRHELVDYALLVRESAPAPLP